jgi:predicted nucleic acid-binding protein
VLVDTSTLLRTLQPRHPHRELARSAIKALTAQGRELYIVPQNLIELWVVATRPADQNGLGMKPAAAKGELTRLKTMFVLLPETPAIYPVWESLVTKHQVSGKPAHDARIVAAMQVHGLTSILTFDQSGFTRYPGIEVIHPADVASSVQE